LLKEGDPQFQSTKTMLSPGAMISFIVKGDEQSSFRFLDSLKMINLPSAWAAQNRSLNILRQ